MILWLPYVVGVAASLSTYLGGLLAMRFGHRSDVLLGMTGGMVLGLALLDLLPEAVEHGDGVHGVSSIFFCVIAGFAISLLMHHLPAGGTAGRITLIAHSLMDGVGIGLAFQLSNATGWLVAGAVIAHDMADGANMVGLSRLSAGPFATHRWLITNAVAPLAGVTIGQAVNVDLGQFTLLLALFAGGFLYIGACELLPRSRASVPGYAGTVASLLGMSMMTVVIRLVG